ncbi:fatty acyl-CoA reductase wat-like [Anoplophora glabripennis]|uniref:fatty acyl-CoA reductase wat-like n=1 Tax=Anoplophora glabripennis TaxID=217634 RepID=UPI0008756535|nr:fatty acyl-CoA reductase wat-like [Anoplophora glabripennis]
MEESNIQKFYKSCNVFITGGTGFMGKLLIEKLLRSTEVSSIYLLIREKKGKNAHSRIDELFDDVIFDRLKRECPKYKNRIEAISGDCSVSGLGLNITDRQKLMSDIHVVFHVAATVKFDENLKLAYSINVKGTKDVLDLTRQMKSLKSVIHVSTAFSNCHLPEIEEKFYDCPYAYEDIGQVLEKLNKNDIEQLTPRIIGPWPNTYTFTKALAESMIKETGSGLPIGIFRPAIVISTYKEPVEGWIDNLYGPTGVCAGTITGVLRVIKANVDSIADIVPADTCVAGLIASAYDVSEKECERTVDNIPIYNYVSSSENPITWDEFVHLNLIHGSKYPVINSIWALSLTVTSNIIVYNILRFLLHTLPALLFDTGAVLSGNKPRILQLYKKIHKFTEILVYFCFRSWKFSNKNTVNMWSKMNRADRELFPFSMTTVHWLLYFRRYIKGMRLYLLKDPDSTLDVAKKRDKR